MDAIVSTVILIREAFCSYLKASPYKASDQFQRYYPNCQPHTFCIGRKLSVYFIDHNLWICSFDFIGLNKFSAITKIRNDLLSFTWLLGLLNHAQQQTAVDPSKID